MSIIATEEKINMILPELNAKEFSDYKIQNIISRIEKAEWRQPPYKAQNWGNWLHRMGAYVGKVKPAIAHLVIKASTKPSC